MAERIEMLQEYLRRYPTGYFSELAQLELDRELAKEGEKKVQPAASAGNPFTKGTVMKDINYQVGDSYVQRRMDPLSLAVQSTRTTTVVRITEREVHLSTGTIVNLLGNTLQTSDGRRFSDSQTMPFELTVGNRWVTRFITTYPNGSTGQSEIECRITGRENITVPAGTFHAFRIDRRGSYVSASQSGASLGESTTWLANEARAPVVHSEIWRYRGTVSTAYRFELVAYKQA